MEIHKKPFKLLSRDRRTKKGVVAESLEELIGKAKALFGLEVNDFKIVLEEDGTEIIENDYLLLLENHTKLMVLNKNEEWAPGCPAYDEIDHSESVKTFNPVKILQKLARSPGSIVLLSEEELDVVSSFTEHQHIGIPQSEVEYLIEACQRELDEKKRIKDALDLVDLYERAKQSNINP